MITIHLQIDEDYIDTFMLTLPKEHITVVEENFKENQTLLQKEFQSYNTKTQNFISYYEKMNSINSWFKELEEKI
jgi:adenylate kinase family enzyme